MLHVVMLVIDALHRPDLEPASFELGGGECIAIGDPSGAGKSLLLRAIVDLDPNEGTVTLDGRTRESMPAPDWRRLVAYLPAEPGWWAEIVAEHFADWAATVALVEALGPPPRCGDWRVLRLSTGERQRLALVHLLLLEPRVLPLDEPTSGLDPDAKSAVEGQIRQRLTTGASALWVTHDGAQARRLARRCLVVDRGRIEERAA